MLDWCSYGDMPERELARQDVAAVNLACADGLPGAEQIDASRCLGTLDAWATRVQRVTERANQQFCDRSNEYENSEAYFRVLCLITVLQRDLGVVYNPEKIASDAKFDTADCFIHGVIDGPGGTCATMPVVYAAVGRRLGYPIRLVEAHAGNANHLFARWEEPGGERFNIEATAKGLSCHPDDYYRTGRYDTPAEVERMGQFLLSQTPRMELAGFLCQRGWRLRELGRRREEAEAFAWAAGLQPNGLLMLNNLKATLNEWNREQSSRRPAGFPELEIANSCGQFGGGLPQKVERDLCGMIATENLLNDVELEERHWAKLRDGDRQGAPTAALVDFAGLKCTVRLQFAAARQVRDRHATIEGMPCTIRA